MKAKELELWQVYGEDRLIVIDPDELTQKVSFYETEAYLFPSDTDMDVIRKALVEYRGRKEDDEPLRFYEILDEHGIDYRLAGDAEDYIPDIVLCFPDEEDIKWAVCRMDDLVLGVSDVFTYWDGSNWNEVWAESDAGKRTKVVIDEDTKECLDRWAGREWYYLRPFTHGYLYKVVAIDGKQVDGKWLLVETGDWAGSLDYGEIIDSKDLDQVRDWVEEEC